MAGKGSHMKQEQDQRFRADLVGGILTLRRGSPKRTDCPMVVGISGTVPAVRGQNLAAGSCWEPLMVALGGGRRWEIQGFTFPC